MLTKDELFFAGWCPSMRRRLRVLYGGDGFARSHSRSVLLLLQVVSPVLWATVPLAGATALSPRLHCLSFSRAVG